MAVYQCSVSVVAVLACADQRQLRAFSRALVAAVVVCLVGYSLTGTCGYLMFGACVQPDLLSSYRPTPDVDVAVCLVAVNLFTTYPIVLYNGRSSKVVVSLQCL